MSSIDHLCRHYDNLKLRDDALKNEPPQPLMDDISTTVSTLYWSTLQLERSVISTE